MSTANKKRPKKLGRPPIGVDVILHVRVSAEIVEKLEEWASHEALSKSEVVRLILVQALANKKPSDV